VQPDANCDLGRTGSDKQLVGSCINRRVHRCVDRAVTCSSSRLSNASQLTSSVEAIRVALRARPCPPALRAAALKALAAVAFSLGSQARSGIGGAAQPDAKGSKELQLGAALQECEIAALALVTSKEAVPVRVAALEVLQRCAAAYVIFMLQRMVQDCKGCASKYGPSSSDVLDA
jgi:hypothetical protein